VRPPIELAISPVKKQLVLSPNASYSGTLKVMNTGANEFDYTVYVRPYQVVDEAYTPDFETEVSRTQISRWVTLESEGGHLVTDELAEIAYTINVPADVPDGGQYAVIFVEAGLDVEPGATGVTTRQRLGHLIYGRVDGTTREEGRLVEQDLKKWWWRLPVQATSLVENTGNVDFDVNYTLRAVSLFGQTRAEEVQTRVVLPSTRRLVTLELADLSPLGVYHVTQEVEVLGEKASITQTVWIISPLVVTIVVVLFVIEAIYLVVKRTFFSRPQAKKKN
jgi:hypothetical protein